MGLLTTIALVGIAAGSVYSGLQQRKAGKEQRKAIRAQQRQADLANARERRSAIRQARMNMASVQSQAALTGLTGSSAASASMSNIGSRLGENLSFLDQNIQLSQQASLANEAAARYMSRASIGQTVAQVGQLALGSFGGAKPQGTG